MHLASSIQEKFSSMYRNLFSKTTFCHKEKQIIEKLFEWKQKKRFLKK